MTESKKPAPRRSTHEMAAPKGIPVGNATVRIPAPPSGRWEDDVHDLARTVKMNPPAPSVPRPSRAPRLSEPPKSGEVEGIELIVIDERQVPGAERRPWRAAEVWTKRRVYGLDSTFRCVEILDRETGRPELTHEMLGARLGGGRMRDKEGVRFSYPLPLPGMEAMFSKGNKHGYTSSVERMIVRVDKLRARTDAPEPGEAS